MILQEYDVNRNAIINPADHVKAIEHFPEVCVSCFSRDTFHKLLEHFFHKSIGAVSLANIEIPVYEIQYKGRSIGLFNAPVGAPACIGVMEELIALGMKKLVLFGTCGVLDSTIEDTSIIIPTAAIRDEGTSYHYAPPSDEIEVNLNDRSAFTNLLEELKVSYHEGKVWTTDAFYRETKDKMIRRKNSGCICVDMECSAVAALSAFRNIPVVHFFYSADNLDHENWDARSLDNHHKLDEKHKIGEIAVELAYRMI